MTLDEQCWIEENKRIRLSQKDWIPKYNAANRILASWPDYYIAGKEGDENQLNSLQTDFRESWIITGTGFEYNTESLDKESKIIHYPESTVVTPIERKVIIPDYSNGVLLPTVLGTDEGLTYFQAFSLTDDNKENIMQTIEKLSGQDRSVIKVWTPDLNSRKKVPKRAASLGYGDNDGQFHIYCDFNLNDGGRSRGVSASVASGEARSAVSAKKLGLPFGIESKIDKETKSVSFSNMQTIGNFNKYTALVAFNERRYVLSAVFDAGEVLNIDERVAKVLSKKETTTNKLNAIGNFLHPVYAHLSLYMGSEQVDDVEWFEDLEMGK